jgi:hypothetical protein
MSDNASKLDRFKGIIHKLTVGEADQVVATISEDGLVRVRAVDIVASKAGLAQIAALKRLKKRRVKYIRPLKEA